MASPLCPELAAGFDSSLSINVNGRRNRPCDTCRRRKSRCMIPEPGKPCLLCRFHYQACTFVQQPQSRKRKGIDDHIERHSAKRRLSGLETKAMAMPRVIRTVSGRMIEEYHELDEPSLLKTTLGLQNNHHCLYIGSTCALEPFILRRVLPPEGDEIQLPHGAVRQVSYREAFLLLPDLETQNYIDELDDLNAIEQTVVPHGKALVNLYFRTVHPSYPILQKDVYIEKYARSYREFSAPLLAAVYLLALHYWSYSDELSEHQKPDMLKLEHLAKSTLRDAIHRPKLSTVQAGLLLLQHTEDDSAELTPQLVGIGFALGLHLDAAAWDIPCWEKGLRNRLGWALYMQDKWNALGSGRPSLINLANWALSTVSCSDFPEDARHEDDQEGSSEVEQGRIMFCQMISLTEILADVLDSITSVRAAREMENAGDDGLLVILDKAKPVQLRLKNWFSQLPGELSLESGHVLKLSSVGYLRLAYLAVEVTLHRQIIIALSSTTQQDPQLTLICRNAARTRFITAIDFMQQLKPQHLQSFWYFASASNFSLIAAFGALLCATSTNQAEEDFYREKIREYRWTLKINTQNGARCMKPAMSLLDANMALLAKSCNSRRIPASDDTGCTAEMNVPNFDESMQYGFGYFVADNAVALWPSHHEFPQELLHDNCDFYYDEGDGIFQSDLSFQ